MRAGGRQPIPLPFGNDFDVKRIGVGRAERKGQGQKIDFARQRLARRFAIDQHDVQLVDHLDHGRGAVVAVQGIGGQAEKRRDACPAS